MPHLSPRTLYSWRNSARKSASYGLACLAALLACSANSSGAPQAQQDNSQPRFAVSFGSDLSAASLDGRVYVIISTNKSPEPRFQIVEEEALSQQIFGVDVDGLAPTQNAIITDDALGYPASNFHDLPVGDYWVQGVLSKYTTFHRSDGHTVKLPMDEGEGQHWNSKPGNFYSVPERVHIDPASQGTIPIHLTKMVPPIPAKYGISEPV